MRLSTSMSLYTPKWTYGIQYAFVMPCTLFIPLINVAFLLRGAVARMAHSFSVNITSRGSQDRPVRQNGTRGVMAKADAPAAPRLL
ncbi:hypothetical protein GGR55DRAFT_306407 [Xylaria sp. FL0064]|nr:hypothetical protein GGR55DRAFT_306407 [Xylaria sp. FL0064]